MLQHLLCCFRPEGGDTRDAPLHASSSKDFSNKKGLQSGQDDFRPSPHLQDDRALLSFQRECGKITCEWHARVRQVQELILQHTCASSVRLYGVAPIGGGGERTFVLLAHQHQATSCATTTAAAATAAPTGVAASGGSHNSLTLGQQLRQVLLERQTGGAADGTWVVEAGGSRESARSSSGPANTPAVLLGNMLRKEAPVFGRAQEPTGTAKAGAEGPHVVAAVPLMSGSEVVGALWLCGPAGGGACGGLVSLSDSRALEQLGLCVSMLLVGSVAGYLSWLSGATLQLAGAEGLQQLLGGLCDALGQHTARRHMLEPQTSLALVPDSNASTALLVSGHAGAAPHHLLALGGGSAAPARRATGHGAVSRKDSDKDLAAALLDGRSASETAPSVGKARAPVVPKGPSSARTSASPGGSSAPWGLRNTSAVNRAALTSGSIALVPSNNPSVNGGGTLRLKPFPLAQTLLRRLAREAAEGVAAGVVTPDVAGGGGAGARAASRGQLSCSPRTATISEALASNTPAGSRVQGVVVEDCSAMLMDPTQPSRDLLLLFSGVGSAAAAATPVQQGGVAHSGSHAALDPFFRANSSLGGSVTAGISLRTNEVSSSSNRRLPRSLLLLGLPVGDGHGLLGVYLTFPQVLPAQLLHAARAGLVELGQALLPLLNHKLQHELKTEYNTAVSAGPGLYSVRSAASHTAATTAAPGAAGSSAKEFKGFSSLVPFLTLGGSPHRPGHTSVEKPPPPPRGATDPAAGNLDGLVGNLGPLLQSNPAATTQLVHTTASGSRGRAAITADFSLLDTGGSVCGNRDLAFISENCALDTADDGGALLPRAERHEGFSPSTSMIQLEELDPLNTSMRAQLPLLVASLQASISAAKGEAAMEAAAATAAATVLSGTSSREFPRPASQPSALGRVRSAVMPQLSRQRSQQGMQQRGSPEPCPAPTAAAPYADSDLAQLQLHSQLGHGGCAVVFKGSLGTLPVAVKVMEMPEVESAGQDVSRECAAVRPTPGSAKGASSPRLQQGAPRAATGSGMAAAEEEGGREQLAARRALLRNAMELAAMATIAHPNIMQVYSTFANVRLARKRNPDGSDRFCLEPALDFFGEQEGSEAPPVCVAIVCEWCDAGCLGRALQRRTFPQVLLGSSSQSSGPGSASRSAPQRFDFKGVWMTLLDVALALRHLHSHKLAHRDIKAANVLLRSCPTDPRGFTAKLADFGFVTLLDKDDEDGRGPYAISQESCGTVSHMAPEALDRPCRVEAAGDVYGFGVLMSELLTQGVRPFPNVNPRDIGRVVKRGGRPGFADGVPSAYRRLAEACWAADPTQRPRMGEVVAIIAQQLGA